MNLPKVVESVIVLSNEVWGKVMFSQAYSVYMGGSP